MNKILSSGLILGAMLSLVGCGGGSSSGTSNRAFGKFIDAPVKGLHYTSATHQGYTDENGIFEYVKGEKVTFSLGNIKIGTAQGELLVSPHDIAQEAGNINDTAANIAVLLQNLDANKNDKGTIDVSNLKDFTFANAEAIDFSDPTLDIVTKVTEILDPVVNPGVETRVDADPTIIDKETAVINMNTYVEEAEANIDTWAAEAEALIATAPVSTDPVVTDPVVTDPVVTDPVVTEPIVTDPVVTDPIVTDPIVTDPIVTDPIVTDPIVTDPIVTDPIVTDPIVTDPIVTDPIVTDPIVTDPIVTDPIVTDPIVTDPIVTDPIVTDPIVTDPIPEVGVTLTTFVSGKTFMFDEESVAGPDLTMTFGADGVYTDDNGTGDTCTGTWTVVTDTEIVVPECNVTFEFTGELVDLMPMIVHINDVQVVDLFGTLISTDPVIPSTTVPLTTEMLSGKMFYTDMGNTFEQISFISSSEVTFREILVDSAGSILVDTGANVYPYIINASGEVVIDLGSGSTNTYVLIDTTVTQWNMIKNGVAHSPYNTWLLNAPINFPTDTVTEPIVTEPVPTDPIVTDPIVTEPVPTDPIVTDPIVTEPVPTDPIVTDPIVTDPVVTDPSIISLLAGNTFYNVGSDNTGENWIDRIEFNSDATSLVWTSLTTGDSGTHTTLIEGDTITINGDTGDFVLTFVVDAPDMLVFHQLDANGFVIEEDLMYFDQAAAQAYYDSLQSTTIITDPVPTDPIVTNPIAITQAMLTDKTFYEQDYETDFNNVKITDIYGKMTLENGVLTRTEIYVDVNTQQETVEGPFTLDYTLENGKIKVDLTALGEGYGFFTLNAENADAWTLTMEDDLDLDGVIDAGTARTTTWHLSKPVSYPEFTTGSSTTTTVPVDPTQITTEMLTAQTFYESFYDDIAGETIYASTTFDATTVTRTLVSNSIAPEPITLPYSIVDGKVVIDSVLDFEGYIWFTAVTLTADIWELLMENDLDKDGVIDISNPEIQTWYLAKPDGFPDFTTGSNTVTPVPADPILITTEMLNAQTFYYTDTTGTNYGSIIFTDTEAIVTEDNGGVIDSFTLPYTIIDGKVRVEVDGIEYSWFTAVNITTEVWELLHEIDVDKDGVIDIGVSEIQTWYLAKPVSFPSTL